MRALVSSAVISLGLTLAILPQYGRSQSDRDFVFTDLDGHLVVRFAGTGATGLDSSQIDEISNAEFSSMVHDRLRADLLFEDEPRDAEWALSMEPQIEQHVKHAGPDFSDLFVECRAASCRVIMEQPLHRTVPEHQAVLETVQESLEAFIATRRQHFEPVFMITAYYQESETSHIKAFLRRTEHALPDRPAGG
ncbi:hypothetical protein [Candidatus Rariloculus sp.]|uniref:hypothetical protein n=1 Tax=Candidatus Rariloculus sp. TaxID=3101265 RepID=UPI003D11B190